jgi:hypothetical protein
MQHDIEINSARVTAEEDVAKNSDDVLQRFDGECHDQDICPLV